MGVELNELHQKIGAELKSMRLLAGFSSYEVFANKNNLSKIQYFKMEKGTNFTLKSLDRILKIHDISIINFFHKFDNCGYAVCAAVLGFMLLINGSLV